MTNKVLFIMLCILLLASAARAMDRSSHRIIIKFIKPIHFNVESELETTRSANSISMTNSLHTSKLNWNHPIPDKKITVSLKSYRLTDAAYLQAFIRNFRESSPSIQIGKADKDLPIPGFDRAGLIKVQYISQSSTISNQVYRVAYTLTDAI